MRGRAPVYLNDLVQKHRPVSLLRSRFGSLLGVRRTNTVIHGRRSFRQSSPHLWNGLREEIKRAASQQALCKVLKADLFKSA